MDIKPYPDPQKAIKAVKKYNVPLNITADRESSSIYENAHWSLCKIYLNTVNGFNEDEVLFLPLNKHENRFSVSSELPSNVKSIRFDPLEGSPCIINDIVIITDNGAVDYAYINGIESNGVILFNTIDPQIVIDFNEISTSTIEITGEIYGFNFNDMVILSKFGNIINKLHEKINELDSALVNIVSSRSWRFTMPIRNMAAFVRKNRILYLFAKSLLSIKRNGIKITLKKILLYRQRKKFQKKTSIVPLAESELIYDCEYQENMDFSEFTPKVKTIAFFLPQFHAIPENDQWWGKGFTEWTNTCKTKPRFTGHYQPREPHNDIGYYDLLNIETLRRQVNLAKQHGIYGFCFYLYWFSGRRLLEKPLDMFLEHPEMDINFCLCWANESWSKNWDGQNKKILIKQEYTKEDPFKFIEDIQKYINDKRYIRIDGKPVILVYKPITIPNARKTFEKWRNHAKKIGIGKILIWICRQGGYTAEYLGITDSVDGEIDFPPNNDFIKFPLKTARPVDIGNETAKIYSYKELVATVKACILSTGNEIRDSKIPLYHTCMLGWDNAARRLSGWTTFAGFSLMSFYEWVSMMVDDAAKKHNENKSFIFVNAWNEWAEGTYLEPDKKYGYANINTLSKAICGFPLVNKNRRIIFAGHDAWRGGGQLLSLHIIRQLKENFGYDVYVILKQGGILFEDFRHLAKKLICLETDNLSDTDVKNWVKYINTKKAICNTVVTGDILSLLTECGVTCISLIHEMANLIRQSSWENNLKSIIDFSCRVVFASEHVRKSIETIQPIPGEKAVIHPQGMYIFNPYIKTRETARSAIRAEYKLPKDSYIVLGAGYGDYRKGFDLFAYCLTHICRSCRNVFFLWTGDIELNMLSGTKKILDENKIKDRLILTGWKNTTMYYAASDIFLLTSREDPFPSVVMEAMNAYLPVVAFEGGGGYTDIVNNETGGLVPMEDVTAMSERIISLLRDDEYRSRIGQNAHNSIENKYNHIDYVWFLLSLLGEEYKKLSVVVPNYNCARFLPERLDSIIAQTYPLSEIIVLDDKSTDESISIINNYQARYPFLIKTCFNSENSGSPFKQWEKGIGLAKNPLVWITEADDVSDTMFVEALVSCFNDEKVNLAYSQSRIIGQKSEIISKDGYLDYVKDISDTKWRRDYINFGVNEVENVLCIKNTIPNVSAVIFRKDAFPNLENLVNGYKYAGDWLVYVNMLRYGKIAFCAQILNSHRRGGTSIINKAENDLTRTNAFIEEIFSVQEYIVKNYFIKLDVFNYAVDYSRREVLRLTKKEIDNFPELSKRHNEIQNLFESTRNQSSIAVEPNVIRNILIVAPDLEIGGGQMAAIRLANYWNKSYQVYLYNARPALFDKKMAANISSDVCVLPGTGEAKNLSEYINDLRIDFVSTHVWWSDKIAYLALKDVTRKPKWIITMHGCYENLMQDPLIDRDFCDIAPKTLQSASAVFYIADKNLQYIKSIKLDDVKLLKVNNGYLLPDKIAVPSRKELNLTHQDFVFLLAARGIKEKGWLEAIKSIIKYNAIINNLNDRNVHLAMIGESEYLDKLQNEFAKYDYLHFLGTRSNIEPWIALCDACLFPTYFISESQPLSLIEFLAQGKPCIATDIGDIRSMLSGDKNNIAGILLPFNEKGIKIEFITDAIRKMVTDKEWYLKAKVNAKAAANKYAMNVVAEKYLEYAV
jgi:glycosyltransferase involved in cell wall biosynthesis